LYHFILWSKALQWLSTAYPISPKDSCKNLRPFTKQAFSICLSPLVPPSLDSGQSSQDHKLPRLSKVRKQEIAKNGKAFWDCLPNLATEGTQEYHCVGRKATDDQQSIQEWIQVGKALYPEDSGHVRYFTHTTQPFHSL
jgi:hypothetical protein